MLILKIIGLAALIFCGIWALFFLVVGLRKLIGGYEYKPGAEYNYREDELYIPTPMKWEKCY